MKSPCLILLLIAFSAAMSASTCDAQVQVRRGVVATPSPQKIAQAVDREVYFIKKVCSPSPEEYQRISDSGKGIIKEMQKMYAEYSKNRDPATWPRPYDVITSHLQKVVQETMPASVSQAYTRELEARQNANVLATASLVTNFLDSHLRLSTKQIETAIDQIATLETTKKAHLPIAYLYQHMLPLPPPDVLPAILTQEQLSLWKLQKHPKYNQPWVNYFNSSNLLSAVRAPGVAIIAEPNGRREVIVGGAIQAKVAPARPIQIKPAPAKRDK